MLEPHPIESEVQLLVEGNDQVNFFDALCRRLVLPHIQIQNFGGVDDLRTFLSVFAKYPGMTDVRSVGIVRDAERNAQSAFQSVQGSLRNAGLVVPDQPARRAGESPSVSVFILPDNRNSGMLETLLCQTFQGEPIDDCIEDFLQCARSASGEDLRNPDKSKAHAFISTMPRPEVSIGVAARRRYWNLDHPVFNQIRAFLQTL